MNIVNVITTVPKFQEFKRQLIALKKYSKRNCINVDVLINFNSRLQDWPNIKISFESNSEVIMLFNKICK